MLKGYNALTGNVSMQDSGIWFGDSIDKCSCGNVRSNTNSRSSAILVNSDLRVTWMTRVLDVWTK